WATFGAAIGIITAPAPRDAIMIFSGIVAGLIVLTPVGVILGLAGGRHSESLAGGTIGLILAMIGASISGSGDPLLITSTGLVMGGLAGATMIGVFWRFPRWCAQLG